MRYICKFALIASVVTLPLIASPQSHRRTSPARIKAVTAQLYYEETGTLSDNILDVLLQASSGNVFADLGLPDAEELQTKVRLCVAICRIIEDRALKQSQVAKILGVNQPKVSALLRYKLEGFSVERLMHFATALEYDVVIELRPKTQPNRAAQVVVVKAA